MQSDRRMNCFESVNQKEKKREMNMKKMVSAALSALLAMSLAGCGSSSSSSAAASTAAAESAAATAAAAEASEAPAASAEAQNIIIAMSPDYPPFDDLTTSGELTGFDYDMGEWLFTWLNENGYNYTHEWKQMSFDTIISAIQTDQYYDSAQVALVTADSPITSTDELKGANLGCQLGSTGETVAEELSPDHTTAVEDMGIAVETLKSGGYDAVILDIAVAKNYEATGNFKMLDDVLLDESTHIIAKEGNTELMDAVNKALAAFLASDDCAKLKEQYGLQ